ncbi:MAG: MFS transporter, partial [Spirochaetales bacterium]|nr:MFS transporter [Spirochaetales bacterium]
IPFLKKVADIPSNLIFIFTTINFAGVILASRVARPFLDRFGSKPQLTLVNLVIAFISLVWIWGPEEIPLWAYFVLGFISMYFIGMVRLLLERLIVNMIPEDDRLGFTSTIWVVFSLVSLLAGLAGGSLADISLARDLPVFNEYSLTFDLMGALAFFNFFLYLFLKEEGSLTANQFLTVMTNPKHLKTIRNMDLLKRVNNPARKEGILIELESDQSHLATQEIRRHLHQATLRDKEMIIRSLFSNPRPELEDDLINEAMDRDSWWRQSAIFALGAYPTDKTREALRKIMRGRSPYISSVAAKSMARVGDDSCHDRILELLERERLDVRICLNLIIALSMMEKNGRYWKSIFKLVASRESYRFTQSLMIIGSRRQNFKPPIEDLFYELNLSGKGGFDALMEEMVDLPITEEEFNGLVSDIMEQNYGALWAWCRTRCKCLSLMQPHEFLRESIVSFRKRKFTPTLALAGLYFTLQLENISRQDSGPSVHRPE